MIAPLRRRHRWMITLLSLGLPALLFLALVNRPDWPDSAWVEDGAVAQPEGPVVAMSMVAGEQDPEDGGDLSIRRHPNQVLVELGTPLRAPDVLAYWQVVTTEDPPVKSEGVPDDAFLLGSVTALRPNLYPLPAGTETLPGRLIFYSLAHQEQVLVTATLKGAPAAEPAAAEPAAAEPATAEPAEEGAES